MTRRNILWVMVMSKIGIINMSRFLRQIYDLTVDVSWQMLGCCSDMKFRQRIAWLGVVIYISLTALICYYMFEISNAFNEFALDHNHNYHTKVSNNIPHTRRQWLEGTVMELKKHLIHHFSKSRHESTVLAAGHSHANCKQVLLLCGNSSENISNSKF
mgnify:CR=1 FL=1